MKNLLILDNGGETLDRYTIVDKKTGDMFGASEQPFNPLGFAQFCGNVADNYWITAYGHSWRRGCDEKLLKKRILYAVRNFQNDCAHVGKPVKWESLPEDVQKFVKQSLN